MARYRGTAVLVGALFETATISGLIFVAAWGPASTTRDTRLRSQGLIGSSQMSDPEGGSR